MPPPIVPRALAVAPEGDRTHGRDFDWRLSLAIDRIHIDLEQLRWRRGWRVRVAAWWLRRKLRRLERRIPRAPESEYPHDYPS